MSLGNNFLKAIGKKKDTIPFGLDSILLIFALVKLHLRSACLES